VKALRALIRVHHPTIVFLSETNASETRINRVTKLLGFYFYSITVGALGRSGICMLWSQNV
jgi:hypothetical protein